MLENEVIYYYLKLGFIEKVIYTYDKENEMLQKSMKEKFLATPHSHLHSPLPRLLTLSSVFFQKYSMHV